MKSAALQKIILLSLGVVGCALFWSAFAVTYATPEWVEDFAKDYIEQKAAERLEETADTLEDAIDLPESDSALRSLAQTMVDRNSERIAQAKELLRTKFHEQFADAIAEIRNLDCECRDRIARFLEEGFETRILFAEAANERVTDFIQYKYLELTVELKQDIRIFSGSNGSVFLILLLAAFVKPRAVTHLFLPGVLLALSTLICSWFYIFEQNWLLTIIQSDYLGFAYLGWLGVAFLLLIDILLNRARVTSAILNAFFNAIGSAFSVFPC